MSIQWSKSYVASPTVGVAEYTPFFDIAGYGAFRIQAKGTYTGIPPTTWDPSTSYNPGDIVEWSGVRYISLTANTNQQPDMYPSDWGLYTVYLEVSLEGTSVESDVAGTPLAASTYSISPNLSVSDATWSSNGVTSPLAAKWGRIRILSVNAPANISFTITLQEA